MRHESRQILLFAAPVSSMFSIHTHHIVLINNNISNPKSALSATILLRLEKTHGFPVSSRMQRFPYCIRKILTNTERKKLTSAHSPAPECHHCEYPENFRHVQNASNPPRQHGKKPAAVIRKKKPAPRRSDILYFPNFPFDLLEHNFSRQAVLSPKIIVLLHLAKCLHI